MTGSLAPLLAVNGLYIAIGAGLLPLLRIADSWHELVVRLGLSYMVGAAAVGILASHLAIVDVPFDLPEVSLLALVSLALGFVSLRRRRKPSTWRLPRPRLGWIVAGGSLIATAVLLGHAARAYYFRPPIDFDAWWLWLMKARALYEFGGADNPLFTSPAYAPAHQDYPLFVSSLEAIDFRAMNAFDPSIVHVQMIVLAFGFAAALWSLLYGRTRPELIGLSILAIFAATPVLVQLGWNYADVPLAFLVGLGLAGLGRWLLTREPWTLVCAALFLGAAMLTKNEGQMFVVVALFAFLVAVLAQRRPGLRSALLAVAAVVLIVLPWRLFIAVHGLKNEAFDLGNALSPSYLREHDYRVGPAAGELLHQIGFGRWGYLVPLCLVALAAALLARRFALALFGVLWAVLSFVGLVWIYWISYLELGEHILYSADRVVATLVIGASSLAPLAAGEALALAPAPEQAEAVPEQREPVAREPLHAA